MTEPGHGRRPISRWVGGHTCTQLLCELPGEVKGDAPEVGVPQQVVQVVAQQLKHQTQVVPEHEVALQVD